MALTKDDIRLAAERLDQAEKTRKQIRQLSLEYPGITIEDAYAIQKAWIEIKLADGRVVKGHKIGLTSKAMQSALLIDEPDSGVLLDDMFFADGGLVPSDRFIGTRVEAELAFIMKKRLAGPGCTMFDVLNATDFVVPALEILDTRIERVDPVTKATRKIFDTIADNAANAGIVLGGRPLRPLDADLRWIGALCYRNGQLEETGLAAGVLNHPATAVAWLANKIAPSGLRSSPVRWCWRDRSFARSRPAKATRSRPTMDRTVRSAAISPDVALNNHWEAGHAAFHDRIFRQSRCPRRHGQGRRGRPQGRGGNRDFSARGHSRSRHPLRALRHRRRRLRISAFSPWCCGSAKAAISRPARRPANISSRRSPTISIRFSPASKFALSFDMQINDKETSWKRNNIHEALKAEAAHG